MARLGVTGEDGWYLALEPRGAPKPKGMWWRTYERIVARAEEAEEARGAALMPQLERFLARHGITPT